MNLYDQYTPAKIALSNIENELAQIAIHQNDIMWDALENMSWNVYWVGCEFGADLYKLANGETTWGYEVELEDTRIVCRQVIDEDSHCGTTYGFHIVIHPLMLEGNEEAFRAHFIDSLKV
jgi:hypothetical protein